MCFAHPLFIKKRGQTLYNCQNYSLSAGQYFDIKIDYVDITEEEFNCRIANYKKVLTEQFTESRRLEEEIMKQLDTLKLTANL